MSKAPTEELTRNYISSYNQQNVGKREKKSNIPEIKLEKDKGLPLSNGGLFKFK